MHNHYYKKLHTTVFLNEAIESLKIKKKGIYIDGTFGYGGHSSLILKNLSSEGKLFAIDTDPYSITYSKNIKDPRFKIENNIFSNIFNLSKKNHILKKTNGILFDLGISTPQITSSKRGFSFMIDGPLDMRMNPQKGISAAQWLSISKQEKIEKVLREYGEERYAKKISYAIKEQNAIKPIITTKQLADLITKIIPKKIKKFKHPATRSFQAIRIKINREIEEIKTALQHSLKILAPKGRIVVISFHSLEDRIVKKFFNKHSKKKFIPKGIPITEKEIFLSNSIKLKLISKKTPNKYQIIANPRSRSAILRTAELI